LPGYFVNDIIAQTKRAVPTRKRRHGNLPRIRKPLTGWALRWMNSNPSQFYCFAFIVTYQVAELFDPALSILKFIVSRRIG